MYRLLRRFAFIAFACLVSLLSANAAVAACATNEIDALGDGTKCETTKFSVTTTSDATKLVWTMTATGEFYADCGDGGRLTQSSTTGSTISGNTITRTGTSTTTYTCKWASAGEHTVRFGGAATGYSTATTDAALSFNPSYDGTQSKVASVSGSLGTMFPVVNGNIPRFYQTFSYCTSLTSLPAGLFSGIDTSSATDTSHMFDYTFGYCSGLTSLPAGLFSGIDISSVTNTSYMFQSTFTTCNSLTSLPAGLFSGIDISSATNTNYMFSNTFNSCSNLTSISADLFSGIDTSAATSTSYMFNRTFSGCSSLTSLPAGIFSTIDTSSATDTSHMFQYTFDSCSNLTSIPAGLFSATDTSSATNTSYMFSATFLDTGITSIPIGVFSGIDTSNATNTQGMFSTTFYNCSSLTSIPANLFSTIDTSVATDTSGMFDRTFYNCSSLTSLPAGLFSTIDTSAATDTSQMFYRTFYGCSNMGGYIPPTTFPNTIRKGLWYSDRMWYTPFSGTQLATSCDDFPGTTQYITGFESNWAGKVSCQPCADAGMAEYAGKCRTYCSAMSVLHAGDYEYRLLADRTGVPSPVLVLKKNDDVCYLYMEQDDNLDTEGLHIKYDNHTYSPVLLARPLS